MRDIYDRDVEYILNHVRPLLRQYIKGTIPRDTYECLLRHYFFFYEGGLEHNPWQPGGSLFLPVRLDVGLNSNGLHQIKIGMINTKSRILNRLIRKSALPENEQGFLSYFIPKDIHQLCDNDAYRLFVSRLRGMLTQYAEFQRYMSEIYTWRHKKILSRRKPTVYKDLSVIHFPYPHAIAA